MKFLIVLAVCLLVVVNGQLDKFQQNIKLIKDDCRAEVGATEEDNLQFTSMMNPTSPTGKCLISCINKRLKIQNEKGDIDYNAVLEFLKVIQDSNKDLHDQFKIANEKCLNEDIPNTDECEMGSKWYGCIIREAKLIGAPNILKNL